MSVVGREGDGFVGQRRIGRREPVHDLGQGDDAIAVFA
jgi:hypothetical protein